MIDPDVLGKRLAETLLMPPGGPLLVVAAGLMLWRRRPVLARVLAWFGLAVAMICSTEAASDYFARRLEANLVALRPEQLAAAMKGRDPPGAVVILSGGSSYDRRDYPSPTLLEGRALVRVVHGAWVARESGLPVLVTGASIFEGIPPEAETMARTLHDSLGVTPRWIEARAKDTAENAAYSAGILKAAGVDSIILVTDALHMRRSIGAFEQAGLHVLPAPVLFSGLEGGDRSLSWLPTAVGASRFHGAFHEWVGLLWYEWRNPVRRAEAVDDRAQ